MTAHHPPHVLFQRSQHFSSTKAPNDFLLYFLDIFFLSIAYKEPTFNASLFAIDLKKNTTE